MKSIINSLIFSLFALTTNAQRAIEIDSKSVKMPRYFNLLAITTAINTATQGLIVYNIRTSAYWYYNETAWTNSATSLALPYLQTQEFLLPLKVLIEAQVLLVDS